MTIPAGAAPARERARDRRRLGRQARRHPQETEPHPAGRRRPRRCRPRRTRTPKTTSPCAWKPSAASTPTRKPPSTPSSNPCSCATKPAASPHRAAATSNPTTPASATQPAKIIQECNGLAKSTAAERRRQQPGRLRKKQTASEADGKTTSTGEAARTPNRRDRDGEHDPRRARVTRPRHHAHHGGANRRTQHEQPRPRRHTPHHAPRTRAGANTPRGRHVPPAHAMPAAAAAPPPRPAPPPPRPQPTRST